MTHKTQAVTLKRPRLSDEFLQANARDRVLAGAAQAIATYGYKESSVATIVRVSRTARNTFYSHFGSREGAALALVAAANPELATRLRHKSSTAVLAFELAAALRHLGPEHAAEQVADAEKLLKALCECELTPFASIDDPRGQWLPPGRHGLPPEFIRENQRHRMLASLASTIAEKGYVPTTTEDIVRGASTSRRTLYEHFSSTEAAALEMMKDAGAGEAFEGVPPATGLGSVAIELVAHRIVSSGERPALCDEAFEVVYRIGAAAEPVNA